MAWNDSGYKIRAKNMQETTGLYYEPENQSKCYRQVWKTHIYPVWGIGYRSYLKYIKADVSSVVVQKKSDRQLELFNNEL
jgi:hypothetical protein